MLKSTFFYKNANIISIHVYTYINIFFWASTFGSSIFWGCPQSSFRCTGPLSYPFMIFAVVLVLGISAKTSAISHNVSGEQEIASLIQFPGYEFSDSSFIRKIKCERNLGRLPGYMLPESAPISQPIDAIPCKLCVVNSTTVIYSLVMHDGLGSRLLSVLENLALAWNRSFSFGGLIEKPLDRQEYQKEKHRQLSVLLGFDYDQLRPPLQRLHFGTCVGEEGGDTEVQQRLDQISQGTRDIFLVGTGSQSAGPLFTPSFVQRWREISGLQKVPATHFKKCGINIALHARRGDVGQRQEMHPERFVTDEVGIQVAQKVQAFLPHSCVHVFSSTFAGRKQTYSPSDFMKYHRVGFQVHLDNPEIDDMAHFAKADVTICTVGTFCLTASMLNPKCVLVSNQHPRIPALNRILYDTSNGKIDLEEQNNLDHCLQTQVLKVKDQTTA